MKDRLSRFERTEGEKVERVLEYVGGGRVSLVSWRWLKASNSFSEKAVLDAVLMQSVYKSEDHCFFKRVSKDRVFLLYLRLRVFDENVIHEGVGYEFSKLSYPLFTIFLISQCQFCVLSDFESIFLEFLNNPV